MESSQAAMRATQLIEEAGKDFFQLDLTRHLLKCGATQAAIAAFRAEIDLGQIERSIDFFCNSAESVKNLLHHSGIIAQVAKREQVDLVSLLPPDERRIFEISAKIKSSRLRSRSPVNSSAPAIAVPGLQLAELRLDRPMLEVVIEFLEHPERACGLVEANTEQQLLLTEGAAGVILGDSLSKLSESRIRDRLREATKMKRRDYFYLPDLAEFQRDIRQALTPNDPNSRVTLSPRMQARDGNWYQYTHEYRAVQDTLGNLYHVGTSIGVDPVPAPEPVTV